MGGAVRRGEPIARRDMDRRAVADDAPRDTHLPGEELSDAADQFLKLLQEHISAIISAGGAIGGGAIGYMAARRKSDAEASKLEAEAEQIEAATIIAPFRTLLEGYEAQARADGARIAALTAEVRELREEVKALRKALDARPRPADAAG